MQDPDCDLVYIVGMVLLVILLTLFVHGLALAQERHHPPEDMDLHNKFYSHWNMPDVRDKDGNRTQSCCGSQDCYPTQFKNVDGTWFFLQRETQQWRAIPDWKLEINAPDPVESPDGRGHVCAGAYGHVYCAVLGVQT